jgi:uncharacterized protein YyaL (SSP411 family)
MDPSLQARIQQALQAKGASYRPETAHRNGDGSPRYTNRLILETSPYLIQHAHNPVDWRPWGEEAFATAKRLNRPVFLSVGYSTCHWCHVMERESFEDDEIARYLNENFIAIKVDREERPDIDSLYLAALATLQGGGGWPMSVWLTAEKEPFYGGTYFPARDGDRGGATGFLTILRRTREAYQRKGSTIKDSASRLAATLKTVFAENSAGMLSGEAPLTAAFLSYRASFDAENGGLRRSPKFPSDLPTRFLLRRALRFPDGEPDKMAILTLERMASGGIRDQIGGGFHRYATDNRWRVPHFEKMLVDNALLAIDYLEGYQASGKEELQVTAREILMFLGRDLLAPGGGFYGALDADSRNAEGNPVEGAYYTWTPAEVLAVLGSEPGAISMAAYGIPQAPTDSSSRFIPYRAADTAALAKEFGLSEASVTSSIESSRRQLLRARLQRPAPHRDEKIVTAWNGLALSAFARAALVLGDDAYLRQAQSLAGFLMSQGFAGGRLRRNLATPAARQDAFLQDYAFLEAGLLDLYEASGERPWLEDALELDAVLQKHYESSLTGGFFLTADDAETPLVRQAPAEDGAEPSGSSVEILNLLRMADLTGEPRYRSRAELALGAYGEILAANPTSLAEMLLALDYLTDAPKEIVLLAPRRRAELSGFLARLRKIYLPNRVLVQAVQGRDGEEAAHRLPLLSGRSTLKGKATAYVCVNRACQLPTTSPEEFERQLRLLRHFEDNVEKKAESGS